MSRIMTAITRPNDPPRLGDRLYHGHLKPLPRKVAGAARSLAARVKERVNARYAKRPTEVRQ